MILLSSPKEVRSEVGQLQREGCSTALIPTMGYLHEGHLALIDQVRPRVDTVAMSIFINPLQFGPGEDLDTYPRDLDRDLALAAERGVDLMFTPDPHDMYPDGEPVITVDPGSMENRLCGAFRPDHFRGVLTVVAKLLSLFQPTVAVFGQKDFQQAVLIRRMVRDLEFGVEIMTTPTAREADGLAMSSRNTYLSPQDREAAPKLYEALHAAREQFFAGEVNAGTLIGLTRARLEECSQLRLQYLDLVTQDTLETVLTATEGSVLAAAVFCGETRLIDNIQF